jgi:hypothetical protein
VGELDGLAQKIDEAIGELTTQRFIELAESPYETLVDRLQELKREVERLKLLEQHSKPRVLPGEPAETSVLDNVAALEKRMGPTLDTGDKPITVPAPPQAQIRQMIPTPGVSGDFTIYGAGLNSVREIVVDGELADITKQLPGEIQFMLPRGVSSGEVEVEVKLVDGTEVTGPAERPFTLLIKPVYDYSGARESQADGTTEGRT